MRAHSRGTGTSRQRCAWWRMPAASTRTVMPSSRNTRSRSRPSALPRQTRLEWSPPGSEGHRRLRRQGDGRAGRPCPPPPGRSGPTTADEGPQCRALAVGGREHLVEVAEEALDARHAEHAAHGLGPGLVAADAARPARPSGGDPGAAERQAGGDQPAAVGAHPAHQVGVAEGAAPPGLVRPGVQADAHEAARHLVRALGVVAGRHPHAADRQPRHLRDAEDPVLPEWRGQRRRQRRVSSVWRRLSISTRAGICRSLAVRRFRHSSSSRSGNSGRGKRAPFSLLAAALAPEIRRLQSRRPCFCHPSGTTLFRSS